MKAFRVFFLAVISIVVAACASVDSVESDTSPGVVSIAPKSIDEFEFKGSYVYPDKRLGYSIRYAQNQNAYADAFIFPVPDQLTSASHKEIVYQMTSAAIAEIRYFEKKGVYKAFEIFSEKAEEIDGRITARVDGKYIKDAYQSYTVIYLTEHQGKLIKIRITAPDSEINRSAIAWDYFATEIISFVLKNIEKA